ncbi:DNA gyrase inhibitor YacG [Oceanobacter mangrovi]|uniref:DNA gyrase inhibitor YacG n=1 Tax=Oceanobacter mangrovi TaxID=2862510 RepID=UPI001C8ED3A0|nr:DNA gyrase inhibitor YacG [Oceanobacter mangrovi]
MTSKPQNTRQTSAANDSVTRVQCPTCKNEVEWKPENRFRPFCSERCKLIDLGEWASEGHRIAGDQLENDVMSGDLDNY